MSEIKEEHLEFIIETLKNSTGSIGFHQLSNIVEAETNNKFIVFSLLERLEQMELIDNQFMQSTKLTNKGWDFKSFQSLRNKSASEEISRKLNLENLELQNENLKFQNSIQDKQIEINNLTIENLRLQNKQLKKYIFYSIVGFISGAILTNFNGFYIFLKTFFIKM